MGTRSAIDLDAYLARIGYDGPREPSLATLSALHLLHPQAIAFENLDPLLGRPVRLDPASLEAKLVRSGRGGYCFEQNLLFQHALTALGFRVSGLAARVLWNRPDDALTPRGHMLLRVELPDGSWLADVGFGGQTLTAPLRLVAGAVQETPHEPFRLLPAGDGFTLQAEVGGEWRTLYRFGLEEQFEVDYEVTNYYLSTHPDSHFRSMLVAARPTAEGRHALLDHRFTTHALSGASERRMLATAQELQHALERVFGVTVPDRAAFAAAVGRLSRPD